MRICGHEVEVYFVSYTSPTPVKQQVRRYWLRLAYALLSPCVSLVLAHTGYDRYAALFGGESYSYMIIFFLLLPILPLTLVADAILRVNLRDGEP